MSAPLAKQSACPGLDAFAESLAQMADEIASDQRLTADERQLLRTHGQQLTVAVQEVVRIILDCPRESIQEHGLSQLWAAIGSAFMIGSRGTICPIAGRMNAARARQARSTKSQKAGSAIAEAARLLSKKHPNWTSNAIAVKIIDAGITSLKVTAVRNHVKKRTHD